MRLLVLTALTMVAFAANSVLNRLALAGGYIDAADFGTIRLFAGAACLGALCVWLRGGLRFGGPERLAGVISLLIYIYGFSAAYTALDAGLGALILFGTVQVTMFAGGLWAGEAMPPQRWLGAALALIGLGWLLWPSGALQISLFHGLLMGLAGVGWGVYSLAGRKAEDALQATAANFILAAPLGIGIALALRAPEIPMAPMGITLAIISGAVMSSLGYALWYQLLPKLQTSVAAVAQLTVPVIALAAGVMWLGEVVTLKAALASALVLGGVAISVLRFR